MGVDGRSLPDFNFDSSGNPVEPEPVSHTELIKQIENSDGPSQSVAVLATSEAGYDIAPAKRRGLDGIEREDWDRPRNEQGQFLTKSEAELRATWQREGGADQAIAKVRSVEATIMAASSDATALQAHVATLPKDIALVAADHMRLATGHGRGAGARKFEQFCDALSPSQLETFTTFWRGLSRGDQDVILGAISK